MSVKQSYNPLSKEELSNIKVGDVIERMLAFAIPMYLTVEKIEDNIIEAGWWTFSQKTGLEIDKDISTTVSYISKVLTEEQKEIVKNGGKL